MIGQTLLLDLSSTRAQGLTGFLRRETREKHLFHNELFPPFSMVLYK